jgi:hypothetical protein
MKALGRFFLLLFLFGNLLLVGCLAFYIVRLPGSFNFRLLPKDQLTLVHTYEDVRDWTAEDMADRSAFVNRVTQSGHADWLPQVASNSATAPSTSPTR